MSERINEIVEVLQEVKAKFRAGMSFRDVKRLRISAIKAVVKRRSIDHTTVSDKFCRQLYPDVYRTADFDRFLYSWLSEDSSGLRRVLLNHMVYDSDRVAIEKLFDAFRSQPTPIASDIDEPSQPERVKQETYRISPGHGFSTQCKGSE